MDQASERYLKRLRRALICPRQERERLLEDAGAMLENFAQENPGAFYKDYAASFGPPEEFAQTLLEQLDPEDISEARARRKRVLLGAVLTGAAVLVLLAGFWFGRQSSPPTETPAPTAETPSPTAEPSAAPTPSEAPTDFAQAARAYTAQLSDGEDIQYPEAVAVVLRLGIMWGKEDGSYFDPTSHMTRGEAAKTVALIKFGGTDVNTGVKETPSFSDIQGHWAEPYIEYLFDMGMAFGDGDGTFEPNRNVTGFELTRMLLCALGYEANAYRLTGEAWASQTDELAQYAVLPDGLYGGLLEVDLNGPVTREVAAQLICNALKSAPRVIVPAQAADGEVVWQYKDATESDGTLRSLLKERFNMDSFDEIEF